MKFIHLTQKYTFQINAMKINFFGGLSSHFHSIQVYFLFVAKREFSILEKYLG